MTGVQAGKHKRLCFIGQKAAGKSALATHIAVQLDREMAVWFGAGFTHWSAAAVAERLGHCLDAHDADNTVVLLENIENLLQPLEPGQGALDAGRWMLVMDVLSRWQGLLIVTSRDESLVHEEVRSKMDRIVHMQPTAVTSQSRSAGFM
jgi:hypothetical protein